MYTDVSFILPMQLVSYTAYMPLVSRSDFHINLIIIWGFAEDFKSAIIYIHAASYWPLVLGKSLIFLEGCDPNCTQALNEQALMDSYKVF